MQPGAPLDRHLARGEAHVFHLERGRLPRLLTVDQRGVDVVVDVRADHGGFHAAVQSPTENRGAETVLIPATHNGHPIGPLTVHIAAASSAEPPGDYRIRVDRIDADDPGRLAAEAALHQLGVRVRAEAHDYETSLASLRAAAERFRALGAVRREAEVHGVLAALADGQGALGDALEHIQRARDLGRQMTQAQGRALEQAGTEIQAGALQTLGSLRVRRGELAAGEADLRASLALWRQQGDRLGIADTRAGLCLVHHRRGAFRQALTCYQDVLAEARGLGDRALEAVLLSNLGGARSALGESDRALDDHHQALALYQQAANARGEAQTLNNLGARYRALGEPDRAVAAYRRALALFDRLGDRYWQARTLNNLAFAQHSLGDPKRAQTLYERALALRREVGDRVGEAVTLSNLGQAYLALGNTRSALDAFRVSHQIRQASGNLRGEAAALQMIGTALAARGEHGLALTVLDRALGLQRTLGNQQRMATLQLRRGEALLGLNQAPAAQEALHTAMQRFVDLREPAGTIASLSGLAQAAKSLGKLDDAQQHAARARQHIESLRARVADPLRRATLLDAQRQVYALEIDLLIQRHWQEPAAGHDREAFAISESGRARSLVELLAGHPIDHGLAPALRARLASAQRRLSARSERARTLRSTGPRASREARGSPIGVIRREAEEALAAAFGDLEAVWYEIHRTSPRLAALVEPRPTAIGAVQRVLDAETLLLVYSLGAERSVVWAITAERFDTFSLPPRFEIDALARATHDDLSHVDLRTGRSDPAARGRLAAMVLGPVAHRLDKRRLMVVADGALHYVPFSALPRPSDAPLSRETKPGDPEAVTDSALAPLVVHHEVLQLPSASLLLAPTARRPTPADRAAPRQPGHRIAVLADPVFSRSDPRLRTAVESALVRANVAATGSDATAGDKVGLDRLPRLIQARREAEAIANLAPDRVDLYLGFDAHRSLVVDGKLDAYRILHFATHGWIDTDHPELSAVVLSRFDRAATPQVGLLSLYDVYNLDLAADVVILSGCRTALGRELWGEGLIGLTRGFLYAGARNVIASLWSVRDQAAASLMESFYRGLLEDGRAPADALRNAQLALRADRRWHDPAYWAPFVLLGTGR